MPGQHKIRWKDSELKDLRNLVRRYNYRIEKERERLIKEEKRYQAANLPKKSTFGDVRKSIETRQDFKKAVETMQHYLDTGETFVVGKRQKSKLEKTVSLFNAKVDRLHASSRAKTSSAWIPKKISEEGLKKTARSPEDLDRMLDDYSKFLKRGADKIVDLPGSQLDTKLTRWQYDLMSEGVDEVNEYRAKEREAWKNAELKYGGKPLGYTRAQVGMDMEGEFPPMTLYTRWSSALDMHKKLDLIMRERQLGYWEGRTELARLNYMETLEACIGNDPVGKIILKQVRSMPLEDFKRVLTDNNDLFDLLYKFKEEGDSQAREDIINKIWNEWNPDKDMHEALDHYIDREVAKL